MVRLFQKWDKILEAFYEHPEHSFTIRELSKKTKIPPSTIHRYLLSLQQENILDSSFRLCLTPHVRFQKTAFFINKLYTSGLLDYLEKELVPETIILFGSIRKGEYIGESDIDLFIITQHGKKLNLESYQKKLQHPIQLFVYKDMKEIPKELKTNILNGIKLQGYIDI